MPCQSNFCSKRCATLRSLLSGSIYDIQTPIFWAAVFAEFTGTMFLVLFGCGTCILATPVLAVALAFGLATGIIGAAIAHVSGGHINPAVTIGFLVTRKISLIKALIYVLVQTSGATLGAILLQNFDKHYTGGRANDVLCTPRPKNGMSRFDVFFVEFLLTFLLVFVTFASCDNKKKSFAINGPVAAGLSVTVGHLFGIELTGAGINPARTFGPAVISRTFDSHWAYWVGPLLAGATASLLYDLIFAVNAGVAKTKAFFTLADYDGEVGSRGSDDIRMSIVQDHGGDSSSK